MNTATRPSSHAARPALFGAPARLAGTRLKTVAAAIGLSAMLGCGAAAPTVQATTPFLEGDAALFDRGISYIVDPGALGAGWQADWTESLEQRVQRSEAIAIITARTVRDDLTPSREVTYRVTVELERELYAHLPREMDLLSRPGDEGFETVQGQEARILEQRFVVFVKWQLRSETGEVEAAFHLEPASETVQARVVELIERMHGVTNGSRTTVHYN